MVKNSQNLSNINAYNPLIEKIKKENIRQKKFKKISQKFTMGKQTKKKINAILLAAGLALGGIHSFTFAASSPTYDTQKKAICLANDDAVIIEDGESFKIDENSFVIVSGDDSSAYDENGTIHNGYIDDEDYRVIMEKTAEEMSNYVLYQVTAESGVNVRSTGSIEDGNIISTVSYQDYVLGYRSQTAEKGDEWISTLSTDGDTIYEGYIREDLLQEVTLKNLMIVNSSSLNLRTEPDETDKRTIMTQISNGSIVTIIGETITSGGREWAQIEYETEDGYIFQGWAATEFLSPYTNLEQKQFEETIQSTPLSISAVETKSITDTFKTNASGSVTGIDISGINPNDLRELLQSGIPNSVDSNLFINNVDTSQISGDINFVYIKLGASGYKNPELTITDYDNYIEQVKVCEELGIPYGFYYYSTSITVEEAKVELEHIKQKIEELEETLDLKNNKLEIVIDIELFGAEDRQYAGNTKERTEAKATLINGIQEAGLSDHVLIYGPSRVMKPDSDQLINLLYLHSMLSNSDNVALWLCSPVNTNGQSSSTLGNDIAYAEEQGFSTVAYQVVLDSDVIGRIDINTMDLEHYEKMLNYEPSLDKVTCSSQLNVQDDERS